MPSYDNFLPYFLDGLDIPSYYYYTTDCPIMPRPEAIDENALLGFEWDSFEVRVTSILYEILYLQYLGYARSPPIP